MTVFEYGEKETEYLKKRDSVLGRVIEKRGHIYRETDPDFFTAVVHQITGQQISTGALETVWNRMKTQYGEITADRILESDISVLRNQGISMRKAEYIREFARRVRDGELDLRAVSGMPDREAVRALTSLPGVGVWTAEMVLLFCLQRPDILSRQDYGIRKGLCMLYHHRDISPEQFEIYRRRFSPCGSVAALYLWEVAAGRTEGTEEPASGEKSVKKGISP